MGLPYEAPSGGYEDDSTAPDADRLTDEDLTTSGYDGYSHDAASAGRYQDADADEDDYDEDDDLEGDDLDEGGFGGQTDSDPGAGRARGPGRM
jgi:hypothetical protein